MMNKCSYVTSVGTKVYRGNALPIGIEVSNLQVNNFCTNFGSIDALFRL